MGFKGFLFRGLGSWGSEGLGCKVWGLGFRGQKEPGLLLHGNESYRGFSGII